jgi:hypothetical protein
MTMLLGRPAGLKTKKSTPTHFPKKQPKQTGCEQPFCSVDGRNSRLLQPVARLRRRVAQRSPRLRGPEPCRGHIPRGMSLPRIASHRARGVPRGRKRVFGVPRTLFDRVRAHGASGIVRLCTAGVPFDPLGHRRRKHRPPTRA